MFFQLRNALIEVIVAPPIQGVVQSICADTPSSVTVCRVMSLP